MIKKVGLVLLAVVAVAALGAGTFVWWHVSAFEKSVERTYDIPLTQVTASKDPAVIERGRHVAHSFGACQACHGDDFAGGKREDFGPLGYVVHGNVTPGANSLVADYTDAELDRLLRHGVKRNGRTALFMPSQEYYWWPEADRVAVISYLRSLPPVDGVPVEIEISSMAKVLDRLDAIPFDVARRIAPDAPPPHVDPAPTAEYGKLLVIACRGCHGEEHLAGGPIPGAPPEIPTPLNLTPHETGLKGWTYEDFDNLLQTGKRKDGRELNEFMPIASLRNMNETEKRAMWAYLESLPPVEFGER